MYWYTTDIEDLCGGDILSEYNECIKKFDKIRDYMRDFYVLGYKSREDFDKKSLRSYDNEKRRIESYLSEYMSFSKDKNGKKIFIEADCCEISTNPLYRAFKAKSFTKNDITLNFIILDILVERVGISAPKIADIITDEYLNFFETPTLLDVSTVRNKLLEYEELGLLSTQKDGKKRLYYLNQKQVDLNSIKEALLYFSETSPLGVIGSFLLDKIDIKNNILCFKHHYIMHALESEIVYDILLAMKNKQKVKLLNISTKNNITEIIATPLKILISVQSGRRYIVVNTSKNKIKNFRLDYVKAITPITKDEKYDLLKGNVENMLPYTWGSSFGDGKRIETFKMKLRIAKNERFIINRIKREGRHGVLTQLDEDVYEYRIEVYDTMEMIPWIRTFIGRIVSIDGTNKRVIHLFYDDMNKMYALYGGGNNDIF